MGVDLTLYFEATEDGTGDNPRTVDGPLLDDHLRLDRQPTIWAAIKRSGHQRDAGRVVIYLERERIVTDRDGQGNPLTWVSAGDLCSVLVRQVLSEWSAAVLTFLLRIPPHVRVYLWWR
jgi:hypothetical protein